MAKRRGLGSSRGVHDARSRKWLGVFKERLDEAEESLKKGDCRNANDSLMYGMLANGAASAERESSEQTQPSNRFALEARGHKLQETFLRACVLPKASLKGVRSRKRKSRRR